MVTEKLALEGPLDDPKLSPRAPCPPRGLSADDSELFSSLQGFLQKAAKADGVDVTDHAAWDTWLGNPDAAPCEERLKMRRQLQS
jgi:hypothetical protein